MARSALLALIAFSPLIAQNATIPNADRKQVERQETVNRLIVRAHTLPPEFAADILLQAAGSHFVADKALKRELIDEAFDMAGNVQNPLPRTGGHWTDSQLGMISASQDLSMDTLSLRARSVEAMLSIDPEHAREMFMDIHLPAWARLTCKDSLAPAFDPYFRTLLAVFQKSFTAEERRKQDDLNFISELFRVIDSPLEIGPALNIALELKSPELLRILSGVLKNISPDPRSTMAFRLPADLSPIAAMDPSGMSFLEAYRGFLVSAYGNGRCSVALEMLDGQEILARQIRSFNALSARLEGLNRIVKDEVQNFSIEESYKEKPFWQSTGSQELLRSLQWLNHGNRDIPGDKRFWTAEERTSLEWTTKANDTLKMIDEWKVEEESSPLDYLYMKCDAYQTLAKLAPPGAVRNRAIDHLLIHLASSYADIEDHVAWFLPAHDLLKADEVFYGHEMARSPNPVLGAYGELSILLGSAKL
jgi:hypothetical protein